MLRAEIELAAESTKAGRTNALQCRTSSTRLSSPSAVRRRPRCLTLADLRRAGGRRGFRRLCLPDARLAIRQVVPLLSRTPDTRGVTLCRGLNTVALTREGSAAPASPL